MARPPRLPPLPAEARLVFLSAGAEGPGQGAISAILEAGRRSPLDWSLVVLLAEREKAVARLHRLLACEHGSAVPPEVLGHLARVARVESFRAMVLEQRLDQLLQALSAGSIPVLLLKGAAVARTVYPAFEDRPMGDLDLWIPPAAAREARQVAEGQGWKVAATVREEAFPGALHQHLPPMTDGTALNLGLDLHTRISGTWEPPGLAAEDLQRRARPFPGVPGVGAPDPADLLLHVCHHFAWSHALAFGGWKAFRDVEVLLAHPDLDREAFRSRVARARAAPLVAWTLHLAEVYGGVTIPRELAPLAQPASTGVPRWVIRPLVRHFGATLAGLERSLPPRLRASLWELALRPERMGVQGSRPWTHDEAFGGVRVEGQARPSAEAAPGHPADPRANPSASGAPEGALPREGHGVGPRRLTQVARHAGWILGVGR